MYSQYRFCHSTRFRATSFSLVRPLQPLMNRSREEPTAASLHAIPTYGNGGKGWVGDGKMEDSGQIAFLAARLSVDLDQWDLPTQYGGNPSLRSNNAR